MLNVLFNEKEAIEKGETECSGLCYIACIHCEYVFRISFLEPQHLPGWYDHVGVFAMPLGCSWHTIQMNLLDAIAPSNPLGVGE